MGMTNTPFMKACRGRNEGRIPIWIMRQAGRYLPEYRAVREKVSFEQLCKSPSLIAEVVRQPVQRFDLDAAILFSDILTVLEPMGIDVSFPDGGPVLGNPVTGPAEVDRLNNYDPAQGLPFVYDGIREIRKVLPASPIIGFAGSPFTLACYLIQGKGSSNFDKPKQFLHKYPDATERLFGLLVDVVSRYLAAQIKAGADVVQLFDSWGGILSQDDYRHWSARSINEIFRRLKSYNVPRILFVNNVAPYLDIVADIDCEVIGVDYRCDLAKAAAALPHKAIQGNLDPAVMFGSQESVAQQTLSILNGLKKHDNFIFNLGHGIQPGTPVESVHTLVETVHGFARSVS